MLTFLLLCLSYFTAFANAQQQLEIVLYTDKPSYWLGDTVNVYGYLFFNSGLVPDGVIALEIDDPTGYELLFRTLHTGTPPSTEKIEILSVIPCSSSGTPKNSFTKGSLAYFNTTVKNHNDTSVTFKLTLSSFDSAQGIMDSIRAGFTLLPDGIGKIIMPFPIPDQAATGEATVYANTFTNLPKLNGTALSIEKTATFNITDGETTSSQTSGTLAQQQPGTFFTNFTVPLYQHPGNNYNVYTTSKYNNQIATAQKTIEIRVPDLNGDYSVNVLDLIIVANALGWTGQPGNIPADVNRDGIVNVLDLILVANWLGWELP